MPAPTFVPDLVIAFTCMPVERPCRASNRLVMTSNSAIVSLLKRGWPKLVAMSCVTCWPSTFSWKLTAGVSAMKFCLLPGERSVRSTQLRPLSGRFSTCSALTVLPRFDWVTLISGASPVTVTDSCRVAGAICRLIDRLLADLQLQAGRVPAARSPAARVESDRCRCAPDIR